MSPFPTELVVSAREYDVLSDLVLSNIDDEYAVRKRSQQHVRRSSGTGFGNNAAAFRSATRVYLGTSLSLKIADKLVDKLRARRAATAKVPYGGLGIGRHRLALSLATLLFLHRVLYGLFTRLRLQLLHEKVRDIRKRYPRLYAALTSKYAPAIGASLSGLALGIYPASQLRITLAIYAFVRAWELTCKGFEAAGYLKDKPWWVGSWMVFAVSQGQLLHAFVFDRDCFPQAYGDFIISNTPEYVQRKPEHMAAFVNWPSTQQIVNSIAEMAHLRWPAFVSPIIHPTRSDILPATIDPGIAPITSGAHPAIQNLSCALIHPSDPSCFPPFLRQILLSFPRFARFFAIYYSIFSVLRIRQLIKTPGPFVNRLAQQILKTALTMTGAVATSWASICLFQNMLPKKLFPKFRFFLGGVLGGSFALIDQGAVGYGNNMYAARTSIDSFWKVGKKRGWWRGVRGGDVWVFVASLVVFNLATELHEAGRMPKDSAVTMVKLLRGEVEIGLSDRPHKSRDGDNTE